MKRSQPIDELIYKRHLRLYRELNDIHIFVSETVPLLEVAAKEHKGKVVVPGKDITFSVPGKYGRTRIAKRNGTELNSLFRRFANRELYENLLVSSVSRFEAYLSDIIRIILYKSPRKLSVGPKGGDSAKQVPVQLIVDRSSLDEVIDEIIELRIQAIFYAEPKEYCAYFNAVSELGIDAGPFEVFFEIKATRDLVVHNSLIVNDVYLKKAGSLSRGKLGDKLKVTHTYFEESLSAMKTLSCVIERETRKKYKEKCEEP